MEQINTTGLRRYICGVKLTKLQQLQYQQGDYIYLKNMRKTNGELFSCYVYKDKNGNPNFSNINIQEIMWMQKEKPQQLLKSYGGVELTLSQQINFRAGKTIFLKGVKKDGETEEKNIFLTKLPNDEVKIVERITTPKIDVEEIKKISIRDYLSSLGYQPQKPKEHEVWFYSPFRNERTPSFKVDTSKNTFKDFGDGSGGSIIDLVMALHNVDFKQAIKALSEQTNLPIIQPQPSLSQQQNAPKVIVTKETDLKNKALLDYLDERCIDIDVAQKFCREIHYRIDGDENEKEYFAIGFKNNSGGWELRNPYFKNCTSKDVTYIKGDRNAYQDACVFEGFMDALSYLSDFFEGQIFLNKDIIVLNSVSLLDENNTTLIEKLSSYNSIQAYLDNDARGQKCTEKLKQICDKNNNSFLDKSDLYKGYNDYNEFRVAKKKEKQIRDVKPSSNKIKSKPKNTPKIRR